MIDAVIFDLDGLLLDSESAWDAARRDLVAERGGTWKDEATRAMLGMSSPEWSRYVRDELGVEMTPAAISGDVVERLLADYRERLPLLPGALAAVERLGAPARHRSAAPRSRTATTGSSPRTRPA